MSRKFSFNLIRPVVAILLTACICCASSAFGQPKGEASSLYANVRKWAEESATAQAESVKELTGKLKRLRDMQDEWRSDMRAYNLQATTYSGLLLLPKSESRDLDKTWKELRDAIASVRKDLEQTEDELGDVEAQLEDTRQQIAVHRGQLSDLQAVAQKDEQAVPLVEKLKSVLAAMADKENILKSIQELYVGRLSELRKVNSGFNDLSRKFDQYLREKEAKRIFVREKRVSFTEGITQLSSELKRLAEEIGKILSLKYWINESLELWNSAGFLTLSLLIVLWVMVWALGRLRFQLKRISANSFCSRFPAHQFFCLLVAKSLPLAGLSAYVYVCNQVDVIFFSTPFLRVLLNFLLVWLATKWGMDAIKNWDRLAGHPLAPALRRRSRSLLATVRFFALSYTLLSWFFRPPSALLNLNRFLFELFFIGLVVAVGRSYTAAYVKPGKESEGKKRLRVSAFVPTLLQLIAISALVADLAGYGNLATYWLSTWCRSAVACLWWYTFYRMLAELDTLHGEKKAKMAEGDQVAETVRWLLIRFGKLVWGVSLIALVLLVWGGEHNTLGAVVAILSRSINVGNMKFSILGVLYAVLTLLATHAAASLWRHIFQTKFLIRSGLETGLQESITTITVYLVWAFGILVALHVFGLNTASLAVAFGALGIGLGFGLQNIFSNFISGIILLFERPIQVGDDVEINGVWATVKKINVRATIVQTYDNASLIIPNSEFISNQVTNWSFKDKRLRRKISVGVAYGSNVELVRQTLLEIAAAARHVLKYPRPDVLFKDFGDSALIFELRVWTDIDHMLEVETAIRFDIDRLFRERRIEIAFPQLDLHIQPPPLKPESPVTGG